MSFKDDVLPAVHSGDYEDAIAKWKTLSLKGDYSIDETIQSWNICARTLEARLIYLSLTTQNHLLDEALEKFRAWLLEQKTAIIEWSALGATPLVLPDNMRVGQKEIDQDHETLFHMANDIRDALRENDTRGAAQAAERMIDEILAHFDREEAILIEAEYPEAHNHACYHDLLRQQAGSLREVVGNLVNGGRASLVTFDALITFLVNDPIAADMDFRPFFAHPENTL